MFDSNVIDKLISIEKKILNSFQLISFYRNSNILKYEKELCFLKNVLLKKEDLLISKLPTDEDSIELILDIVHENKGNYFDDDEESFYVLERFRGILKELLAQSSNEYDYYDEDYELIDSPKNVQAVSSNIDTMLIKKLTSFGDSVLLDNITFMSLYRSYRLSRWAIFNEFDFSNLNYCSDKALANMINLDDEDYSALLNDVIYNDLESLLSDVSDFLSKDEDSPVLKQVFMRFKLLVHIISNDGIKLFKKLFDGYYKSLNDKQIMIYMNEIINEEFKSRNIVIPENNKSRKKLPVDVVNSLIDLIKLEGKIYSIILDLDFDFDEFDFSELFNLMEEEKNLINLLKVDDRNSSVIKSVIEEDLSWFLNFDDKDLNVISKRLFNVIGYYYSSNISPMQSFESYDSINKNHIVNSLKNYLSFYNSSEDYILNLKRILFVNPFLTFDYICTGNIFMLEIISDDIICDMLGMDSLEYEFDKNEQLYERADDIMNSIFNYDDMNDEEKSFLLCEMKDIKDNLSQDYIDMFETYDLPSSFDDDLFGKMVSDLVRDKRSLKSIIKKR